MRYKIITAASALAIVAATTSIAMASGTLPLEEHSCGDGISHSMRLANDIDCPVDQNGLAALRDGITIDLNHRTISTTYGAAIGIGIGKNNVTVRNGVVRGFDTGVLVGATGVEIESVTATLDPTAGFEIHGANETLKKDSALSDGSGFFLDVSGSRIQDNIATDNDHSGLGFPGANNNNTITDNYVGGNRERGISIAGNSNRITGNSAAHNSGIGIVVAGKDNIISGDTVVSSGSYGIVNAGGHGDTITNNVSTSNGNIGIVDGGDKTTSHGNASTLNLAAVQCTPEAVCS